MKAGEIYKKDDLVYMIVDDYGKFRPMVIDGSQFGFWKMNMSYDYSPKKVKEKRCNLCGRGDDVVIYEGEQKIADSIIVGSGLAAA